MPPPQPQLIRVVDLETTGPAPPSSQGRLITAPNNISRATTTVPFVFENNTGAETGSSRGAESGKVNDDATLVYLIPPLVVAVLVGVAISLKYRRKPQKERAAVTENFVVKNANYAPRDIDREGVAETDKYNSAIYAYSENLAGTTLLEGSEPVYYSSAQMFMDDGEDADNSSLSDEMGGYDVAVDDTLAETDDGYLAPRVLNSDETETC